MLTLALQQQQQSAPGIMFSAEDFPAIGGGGRPGEAMATCHLKYGTCVKSGITMNEKAIWNSSNVDCIYFQVK